jgi:hypothetical protein
LQARTNAKGKGTETFSSLEILRNQQRQAILSNVAVADVKQQTAWQAPKAATKTANSNSSSSNNNKTTVIIEMHM